MCVYRDVDEHQLQVSETLFSSSIIVSFHFIIKIVQLSQKSLIDCELFIFKLRLDFRYN